MTRFQKVASALRGDRAADQDEAGQVNTSSDAATDPDIRVQGADGTDHPATEPGEGTNADTEALRETLRMYKTFLDQLLIGPRAGGR